MVSIDKNVTTIAKTIPKIPKRFPRRDVSGDDNPLKANIKRIFAIKYNIVVNLGGISYFLFSLFFCIFLKTLS